MKKWIVLFLAFYVVVGIFWFLNKGSDEEITHLTDQEKVNNPPEQKFHMYWTVGNSKESNYKAPYWLTRPNMTEYVEEKTHEMEKVRPTDSDDRLMTFFAQVQLGDFRHISSFINPMISYKDLMTTDIKEIDKKLKQYANQISKNGTIQAVYLSKPTSSTPDSITYNVTLSFQDGSLINLKDVPMVKMNEDINWFVDLTLTEIASLVEPALKKGENLQGS